jgi:hypothetical protein
MKIPTSQRRNFTSGEQKHKDNFLFQVTGNAVVEKPCAVKFSFKNPLKKELTACIFQYAGPGLARNTSIPYRYSRIKRTLLYYCHSVSHLAPRTVTAPLDKVLYKESIKKQTCFFWGSDFGRSIPKSILKMEVSDYSNISVGIYYNTQRHNSGDFNPRCEVYLPAIYTARHFLAYSLNYSVLNYSFHNPIIYLIIKLCKYLANLARFLTF